MKTLDTTKTLKITRAQAALLEERAEGLKEGTRIGYLAGYEDGNGFNVGLFYGVAIGMLVTVFLLQATGHIGR